MHISLILLFTALVGCGVVLDSTHAKNTNNSKNNGISTKASRGYCTIDNDKEVAIGQHIISYPKKDNDDVCVDCICGPDAKPRNCKTKRCMKPTGEKSHCVLVKDGPYCCMNVCEFWSPSKPIHINPTLIGSPVLKPETSEEIDKRLNETLPTRKPGHPETLFERGLRVHRWLWVNDQKVNTTNV